MRSRLGVALTPFGLNGPRTWKELMRYIRSWPPPGANICWTSSDSAKVRRRNATPTRCGPAVVVKRMFFRRAFGLSRAPFCTWSYSFMSSSPPITVS